MFAPGAGWQLHKLLAASSDHPRMEILQVGNLLVTWLLAVRTSQRGTQDILEAAIPERVQAQKKIQVEYGMV